MEPIQKKSNNTVAVVVSVLVIIVVALLLMSNKKDAINNDSMVNEPDVENVGVDNTGENPSAVDNSDREGTSLSNAGKYAELVLKYEGRTLQFNDSCQISKESKLGFKQGTDVLLDNRSDEAAKVVIGSRTFNLKARGYKVIDLGSVGTYKVDCNDKFNVLTLTVQK